MDVKIAGYRIAGHQNGSTILFDHEPSVAGFYRTTEWVTVTLPDLVGEELAVEKAKGTASERAELQAKIDRLTA